MIVLHPCLNLTAPELRTLRWVKLNAPADSWGRFLYGLNYQGRFEMYDVAEVQIRSFYDDLARSLSENDLRCAAMALEESGLAYDVDDRGIRY